MKKVATFTCLLLLTAGSAAAWAGVCCPPEHEITMQAVDDCLAPAARIASGGELSRLVLSLRLAAGATTMLPDAESGGGQYHLVVAGSHRATSPHVPELLTPADPSLIGAKAFFQWSIVVPGASQFPVFTSDALEVILNS